MQQFQEYSTAWIIYGIAVVGLLLVTWRLCRGISWAFPRRVLILTALVLMATPGLSEINYWAPAWIIAALELLFTGVEGAMPALIILFNIWLVAMACLTVLTLVQQLFFLVFSKSATSLKHQSASKKSNGIQAKASKKVSPRSSEQRIPPRVT